MKMLLRGDRTTPQSGPARSVPEPLSAELRRRGFDLRRAVDVTYLLELGPDRDGAFAIRDRAAQDGWRTTLFGDASGWVVRLGRCGPVRQQLLDQDADYLDGLTRAHGGRPRGVCVEDLDHAGVWDDLAAAAREDEACENQPSPDEARPALPGRRGARQPDLPAHAAGA